MTAPDARAGSRRVEAPPKKVRGRETAGDMIRSLGVVLVLVVLMWFLAQPPDGDEQEIRVVDPSTSIASFADVSPEVPVPGDVPAEWRATSSAVTTDPLLLRVGWVTSSGRYAEYAASRAPRDEFVPAITGDDAVALGSVEVGGASWERYEDGDGSLSLVRSYGSTVVVVGTLRATATRDELERLVSGLETR